MTMVEDQEALVAKHLVLPVTEAHKQVAEGDIVNLPTQAQSASCLGLLSSTRGIQTGTPPKTVAQ